MLRPLVTVLLSMPLFAQGWVDRTPANPLTSPSPRFDPAMGWDGAHGYVMMFGGMSYVGNLFPGETWTWDGSAWTQRLTANNPYTNLGNGTMLQTARRTTAMTFHTPANEVLLVALGSTYAWTGSDWLPRANSLPTAFQNSGIPADLALGRDEARSQTVLFVGMHVNPNSGWPIVQQGSETLLWDGFSWSLRPTATHPYPAEQPSMAFDPVSGRLLLCTTDAANSGSWFWDWNGSNWTQRAFASTPAAGGVLASDAGGSRVVMLDASLSPSPDHTWTFAGSNSARLGLGAEPTRRQGAGAAFDPLRHRTVVFGGINGPVNGTQLYALADTWEFELGAGAAFTTFGSGCAGSRGVVALDAQNNSLPRVGRTFELHVGNLPFTGPAFLFLGFSDQSYGPTPLPFVLDGLGAPGCSILASGDALMLLSNVLGNAAWTLPIPNVGGTVFFTQAFALDPAANALGLTSSNGGQATVGF